MATRVPDRRCDSPNRPWPWWPQDARNVLNGILWKLRTGASWNDLPLEYPSHQTCHRYYTVWLQEGLLGDVMAGLADHLSDSDFDLHTALENNDIELIPMARKTRIQFSLRFISPIGLNLTPLTLSREDVRNQNG